MSGPPEPRYERKFVVTGADVHQVHAVVLRNRAMFSEAYPPRRVNNIYLDTPLRSNYADNLLGAGNRIKARVRWYGALFGPAGSPTLEFKIKHGLVGWKETYPLPGFTIVPGFHARAFIRGLAAVIPPEARARVAGAEPALVNSYHRWYFANREGFRLTLDDDLRYYRVHHLRNRFLVCSRDRRRVVVELKYPKELEMRAQRIAASFPFRVGRNSKYALGLEAVEPGLV